MRRLRWSGFSAHIGLPMPTSVMFNHHATCTSDGPGHVDGYDRPERMPPGAMTRVEVTDIGNGWLDLTGPGGTASRWWHHDADRLARAAAERPCWLRVDSSGSAVLHVGEVDTLCDTWQLAAPDAAASCRMARDRSDLVWVALGMLAVGLLVAWTVVDGSPDDSPGLFALVLAVFGAPLPWLGTRLDRKEFREVPFWVVYVGGAYLVFTALWAVQWLVGPQSSSPPPYDNDVICDMFGCQ